MAKIKKLSNMKRASRGKESKFKAFIESMSKLTEDGCLTHPYSDKDNGALTAALRRAAPKPPKGYGWQKRKMQDGGQDVICIFMEKIGPGVRFASWAKGGTDVAPAAPKKKTTKKKVAKKKTTKKKARK